MANNQTDDADFNAWYLNHKRRWPLALLALFALPLSVFMLLAGYGRDQARKNYPRTVAALEELQPKPVPHNQNAAHHWRVAIKQRVHWEGKSPDPTSGDYDWTQESAYAADSPARQMLAKNSTALSYADQAAALKDANWDIQYSRGELRYENSHLRPLWEFGFLLSLRARLAAYDGDISGYFQSLDVMRQAGRHAAIDKSAKSLYVEVVFKSLEQNAIRDPLMFARTAWTPATLAQLKERCFNQAQARQDLATMWRTDGLFIELQMDTLARGEGEAFERLSSSPGLPLLLNWYAVGYPWDRAAGRTISAEIIASVDNPEAPDPTESISRRYNRLHLVTREAFYSMLTPSLNSQSEALKWRVTFAGVAALEYRATHNGAWPKNLDELKLAPQISDVSDMRMEIDGNNAIWIWHSKDELMKNVKSISQKLAGEARDTQKKTTKNKSAGEVRDYSTLWRKSVFFSPPHPLEASR